MSPEGKSSGGPGKAFLPVTDTQIHSLLPLGVETAGLVHLEGSQPGNGGAEGREVLGLPGLEPLNSPTGGHLPQLSCWVR